MSVQTKEITFQEIAQKIIETVASKDFPQLAQRAKEKEIIVKYQDAYDETMKKEEEKIKSLKKKKEITQEKMMALIREKHQELSRYFINLQEQERAALQEEIESGVFQENLSKRADVSINFVGGVVRDEVLGVESHDKDINITGITEFEFQELFPQAEYQGKDFGVFRMFAEGEITEFAFSRTEKKVEGLFGHKAFEVQTSPYTTLEEDLYRRDITINAMAKNVLTGEIVDPYGGLNDLQNGIIRATSEAFKEDPLRVLRVARFAAKFGFTVDAFTKEMMSEVGSALGAISKERVHGEFLKMLEAKKPSIFFNVLKDVNYEENGVEQTLLSIHFEALDTFAEKDPSAYKALLHALDQVKTNQYLIKIAALTHLLLPEEAKKVMTGIKASKEETQLAEFIATYYQDMVDGMTDEGKIESFLQELTKHPFTRQRESEEWFYEAAEVIAEANDVLEVVEENHLKFRHMIAVLNKEIKPDLSLKGKAVGDDLRKRRVEKIKELQSLPADPGILLMKRAFRFEKPSVYFRALKEEGHLNEHYKELVPLVGMPQNESHHPEGEVFEHAMQCLDAAAFLAKERGLLLHEKEKVLFSVYGHDLGKGATLGWKEKVTESGEVVKVPTHHKHEYVGMKILKFMAKEKTYPVHWVRAAQYAAEYHMHYHRFTEMNIKKQVDLVAGFVRPISFANEEGEKEISFETQRGVEDTIGLEGMLIVIEADKRGRIAVTEDVEKVLQTPLEHPMKASILKVANAIFSVNTQPIFLKAQQMETKEKQLQFFHEEVRKARIESAKKCKQ